MSDIDNWSENESIQNDSYFTGHGGDINIYDEMKMTPLHRTATSSIDTHLFKLLCDNGANINALDCRGNSPLLAMCDVAVTDDYDFFEDWSTTSDDTYEETSAGLCVQHQFLDYMLLQKNIQVVHLQQLPNCMLCRVFIKGKIY